MKELKYLHYVAGALLALMVILMFLLPGGSLEVLRYAGWVVWAVAMVLIAQPLFVFPRAGKVEKGESYIHTKMLVDSGVYAVVRHPQYLGWFLMYPAMMCFSQHWLIIVLGIAGMTCVYLFIRQADERLVEKFGEAYEQYMQTVPGLNIVLGIIELARQRMAGDNRD